MYGIIAISGGKALAWFLQVRCGQFHGSLLMGSFSDLQPATMRPQATVPLHSLLLLLGIHLNHKLKNTLLHPRDAESDNGRYLTQPERLFTENTVTNPAFRVNNNIKPDNFSKPYLAVPLPPHSESSRRPRRLSPCTKRGTCTIRATRSQRIHNQHHIVRLTVPLSLPYAAHSARPSI